MGETEQELIFEIAATRGVKRQCVQTEIVKTLDKDETFSVHVLTACVHEHYRISERNENEALMDKSTVHSYDKIYFLKITFSRQEHQKAILKTVKIMWFWTFIITHTIEKSVSLSLTASFSSA